MHPVRIILCACVAALLWGCASTASPDADPDVVDAAIPFRCPKPGTAVTFNDARRPVRFNGADPSDPLACLATNPDGSASRRIGGYVVPPPGQDGAVRDGMAALFPIIPGKATEFSYFQGYRNERTSKGQFVERWTTGGPETVTVAGKPVRTILFTREVENNQSYGSLGMRWRLWYAPDSGVWVKGEPTLLRGDARLRPFLATSLAAP